MVCPPRIGVSCDCTKHNGASALKKLMAANNVVILDVRSAESYAAGHIPGALSLPEDTITQAVAGKLKKMGKPIATYCS